MRNPSSEFTKLDIKSFDPRPSEPDIPIGTYAVPTSEDFSVVPDFLVYSNPDNDPIVQKVLENCGRVDDIDDELIDLQEIDWDEVYLEQED